jgi:hypothetical protein
VPAELRVYAADDPTSLVAVLDQPFAVEWTDEIDEVGAGQFVIPHDSPAVQANPTVLDGDNVVRVRVGTTDVFAWLVERKLRSRGDVWDPIQVAGPGVKQMLDGAVVYQAVRPHAAERVTVVGEGEERVGIVPRRGAAFVGNEPSVGLLDDWDF